MSRTNNPKVKKPKKDKPVSKDPRPQWSSKKYKSYGEFREAVKAWRIRNGFAKAPKPKEKKKYVSPQERKFGKSKLKINKEIEQQVETYVQKSKGDKPIRKVKYPSANVSKKDNKKDVKVNKEEVETPKVETPKVETPKVETKKPEEKKKTNREKFNAKFIKTKGGRLAKRGTPAAMKAENRERARKKAQAARLRIKKKKKK